MLEYKPHTHNAIRDGSLTLEAYNSMLAKHLSIMLVDTKMGVALKWMWL